MLMISRAKLNEAKVELSDLKPKSENAAENQENTQTHTHTKEKRKKTHTESGSSLSWSLFTKGSASVCIAITRKAILHKHTYKNKRIQEINSSSRESEERVRIPMMRRMVEMGRLSASATVASSAASNLSPRGAIAFLLISL